MDETQPTQPIEPTPSSRPSPEAGTVAASDAASAPVRSGFTLRGRRWAYGATLAAAGVLAGSGVTYAVVSSTTAAPTVQSATQQGGPGGSGARGPMGAPPDGTAPQGTAPDGTAPSTQPSDAAGSAQDGETT